MPSTPEPTQTPLPANPLAGSRLWVDPLSTAAKAAAGLRAEGRDDKADELTPIVSQPVATWVAADDPEPLATRVVDSASAADALPVLVLYHRPHRDCGSYSAGGSADAADYRQWIGQVADAIGDRSAVVILEPDAVAQLVSGACSGDSASTYALLADAVQRLSANDNTLVYLDAGHPGWVEDITALTRALRASGVDRAAGFALNVANFHSEAENIAYGDELSAALGGKQYVVDVSRNGGGVPDALAGSVESWCNPPTAGLGANPAVGGDRGLAVAFLWIKEPGASDGSCRDGEPVAGQFWFDYAVQLIRHRR